jgi:hypothetical protein
MVQIKEFPISWLDTYRARQNSNIDSYNNIWVGGADGYNTYVGFPSTVRNAIKTSKTTPKLRIRLNVVDSSEFDFGAHKENSRKGYGTMPWYTYIGLHPTLSVGTREVDLTSAFMNDYKNGTYSGLVLYGAVGSGYGAASGLNAGSNNATILVEGTWNTPPSKPQITYPYSSTVVDDSLTVTWNASSDAEQSASQISYEVKIRDAYGNWSQGYTTGAGSTQYTLSTTSMAETSDAQIAVRAFDGTDWSGYSYSSSFTISHNNPPAKPTYLSPSSGKAIDRTSGSRFSWRHNDDGIQAGYKLRWKPVGSSVWNYVPSSGYKNSTNQYHDFGSSYFPKGEIEWQVSTLDQQNLSSSYSNIQKFNSAEPTNSPIFLTPTNNSSVNASQPDVGWSSVNQSAYELELLNSSSVVVWSESDTSGAKSTRIDVSLTNNSSYTLRGRVRDASTGLWSLWSEVSFTTQFTPPERPTVSVYPDLNSASLEVEWDSDPTGSSETVTTHVDLYRREFNDYDIQEWIRIGTGLEPDGKYVDLTPASDTVYQYKVRAFGDNETSQESYIAENKVVVENTFLQRANVLSDSIRIVFGDSRDEDIDFTGNLLFFANRTKPIFEFGISEEHSVKIEWIIDSVDEKRVALKLLRRKETLLYRDNNGRRMYCVASQPSIKDRKVNGFVMSITLTEVDFLEGV